VDVGPERDPPADRAAEDSHVTSVEAGGDKQHIHPMDFAELQSSGRFVRDSRVGGMFHPGQMPLREDSPTGSLHVSIGQDNRVSVHIDRFSPLAKRKPGKRRGYSVRRVILHNVGIVVDYVSLVAHRRFGEQRCELECERICDDDHDECDASTTVGLPASVVEVPEMLSPIMGGEDADRAPEVSGELVALPPPVL
jgi:hypothetical protein